MVFGTSGTNYHQLGGVSQKSQFRCGRVTFPPETHFGLDILMSHLKSIHLQRIYFQVSHVLRYLYMRT